VSVNPFLRTIDALNAHQVRYVIVGGFAAYLHGSRRATVDIDLVVDLSPAEAKKAIEALLGIGMHSRLPVDPLLFADDAQRRRWSSEKQMMVFSMIHPDHPGFAVDLFVEMPSSWTEFQSRSTVVDIEGRSVRICCIDDLIDMKRRSGRAHDLQDVDTLTRLKSFQAKPSPPGEH